MEPEINFAYKGNADLMFLSRERRSVCLIIHKLLHLHFLYYP